MAMFKEGLFDFDGTNDAAIWRDSLEAHFYATMTTTTSEARNQAASPLM